ncbi:hypothetical protein [Dysgonomonas sp. ZJ709]|uniref:hypothetical protein n=1 Tax=Dysgonomonas sp. ZJ709 TaxID=2709797 RepID=UPI0013EA4449|nr:hypothetical protein [Dysgonomonas sp. ZJ709]
MAKRKKDSSKRKSAKIDKNDISAKKSTSDALISAQIKTLNRAEVIRKIKEQISNDESSNINESEEKRLTNKINLICTYLEYTAIPDDNILHMFSLFLLQEENILYNFGYFSEKIPTFKESILHIQQRLDHIIKCCNSIPEESLNKYIFRFDELYDFYFENSSFNAKIEIQNIHNFSFNYKRKYILRILDKATNLTVSIQELDSLNKIQLIEKEKTIKTYTITND